MSYCFPFGQPLRTLQQIDRTPKDVFVLGVYASAVHAKWRDCSGAVVCPALAVASEPYIFWRGEGAAEIVGQIEVPAAAGTLEAAHEMYNGPSGKALDEQILAPLGVSRDRAWLCDLVPHSCVNGGQAKVIREKYLSVAAQYGLPTASVPEVPEELTDADRRAQIIAELRESEAKILIVLGDQPIRWFLNKVGQPWKRLSEFKEYGRLHSIRLDGMKLEVLPLVHPRQAARLGMSSQQWYETHEAWRHGVAKMVVA
jgi:uracil-DNA glycosylase